MSADGTVQGVLTGQVLMTTPPECEDHREVQHRDGRGPWCDTCGWSHRRVTVREAKNHRVSGNRDG